MFQAQGDGNRNVIVRPGPKGATGLQLHQSRRADCTLPSVISNDFELLDQIGFTPRHRNRPPREGRFDQRCTA